MISPWTAKTIHFMTERRQKVVGVFLNEPFLVSPFQGHESDSKTQDLSPLTHIKCLGVILLQVALGKCSSLMACESAPEISFLGEMDLVQQFYVASVALKDRSQTENIPPELLNVIKACMQPDITFKAYFEDNNSAPLRMAIWRNLASPLMDLVEGTFQKHPDVLEVTLPTVTREEIGNPPKGLENTPMTYSGHSFAAVLQDSHRRHGEQGRQAGNTLSRLV